MHYIQNLAVLPAGDSKMNIYVGNISREATEDELRSEFEQFGTVTNVSLIKDKFTNSLKGFGFVDMPNKAEAEKAIENLHGAMVNGRPLTVNVAKPKVTSSNDRPRRYNTGY
jgi:RNA recognition motif-containing protein